MSETVISIRRGPLTEQMGVQITGTGSYLPDNVVTNEDLARLGCDPEWIVQRTGIHERRHTPTGMATSDMATKAAERAIEASGVNPKEIDLLLLGTFTPDRLLPQAATLVQHRLGLNCPAMDLSAGCAGFMYSLITGVQFIAAGGARNALVIGADNNTCALNPDDKKTYPLFGDGAGAVVLSPGSPEQGMLAGTLGADGSGAYLLTRRVGGSACPFGSELAEEEPRDHGEPWLMEMEGRPVFKWAVRLLEDTFEHVLTASGCDRDQISLWILHQANARILDAAAESMGLPPDRVVKHLDRYGNTSGGTIPIALDESFREGRIKRGDDLVLCGFGAGLSWGTAVWRW